MILQAIMIDSGSIFVVKTKENKYGIMLITEAKSYKDTVDTINQRYDAYVTFKWKYQTDGSRNFSKK